MPTDTPNPYDLVPYESHPFPQTHPTRLATVGTLFGMRPAPVQKCRVLELGCAAGGNLIPMAVQSPDSHFVGVDLSKRQIDQGNETISALGLTNIQLRHANISDVDDSFGKFDYLMSHGVFSWVPTDVQDAMFQIAARNLNPQGIAYISYNTYPGWHMRGLVREMMRYHAANFSTPTIRTRQARSLLDFLATSVPQDGGAFSALLRQEVEVLRHHADYYLFHEHLEEINSPLFFHQFIERAARHDLQYLGESNVRSMIVTNLPEGVQKALRVMSTDQIQLEQYMDFLRNRTFRETLLCRANVPLNRGLDGEPIRRLWLASRAEPVNGPPNIESDEPIAFKTPSGYTLTTSMSSMKAALVCLRAAWPRALAFDELIAAIATPSKALGEPEKIALASRLTQAYVGSDLIELFAGPLPCVTKTSERPVACPYARRQATHGHKATNRRHETIGLSPFMRALLPLLNGTRTRDDLLAEFVAMAESGHLTFQTTTGPDSPDRQTVLARAVEEALEDAARGAILVV